MNTTVGGLSAEQVGMTKSVTVGQSYTVTVADEFTLTVGAASLVLKKDGSILLNGKRIDIVGSQHVGVESDRIDLN